MDIGAITHDPPEGLLVIWDSGFQMNPPVGVDVGKRLLFADGRFGKLPGQLRGDQCLEDYLRLIDRKTKCSRFNVLPDIKVRSAPVELHAGTDGFDSV